MAAVHESHENYSEVRCSPTHAHSLDCKKGFYLSFSQLNVSYFPRNSFLRGNKEFPDTSFKLSTFLSWNCDKSCFDLFHFQLITIHHISKWLPYQYFFAFIQVSLCCFFRNLTSNLNEATKADFGTSKGRLYCRPYWTNALNTYFWDDVFFLSCCCFFFRFLFWLFYLILHLVLFTRFCFFAFAVTPLWTCLAPIFLQTAHCYIHAAALVAEYLKRQGNAHKITETEFLHDPFFLHVVSLSGQLSTMLFVQVQVIMSLSQTSSFVCPYHL